MFNLACEYISVQWGPADQDQHVDQNSTSMIALRGVCVCVCVTFNEDFVLWWDQQPNQQLLLCCISK